MTMMMMMMMMMMMIFVLVFLGEDDAIQQVVVFLGREIMNSKTIEEETRVVFTGKLFIS